MSEAPSGLSDRLLDRPLLSLGMSSKYIHSCRQKRRESHSFHALSPASVVPASPKQPVDPIRAAFLPLIYALVSRHGNETTPPPPLPAVCSAVAASGPALHACVCGCVCAIFKFQVGLNVRRRCRCRVASPRCRPEVL